MFLGGSNVIDIKPLHFSKQPTPNDFTNFGIVIDVKPLHFSKQPSPNDVTEDGIVFDVKLLQS
jgi:hypothetical protein